MDPGGGGECGKRLCNPPTGPVKISHRKDGCQGMSQRFYISWPSPFPTWPLDPLLYHGLFPPTETETETDFHMDYCTKQVFPLVWRRIPIPLLKYSKTGTVMCPADRDPSLKWVQ